MVRQPVGSVPSLSVGRVSSSKLSARGFSARTGGPGRRKVSISVDGSSSSGSSPPRRNFRRGLSSIEDSIREEDDDDEDDSDENETETQAVDSEEEREAQKQKLLFANHMNTLRANRPPKVSSAPAPPTFPVRKPEQPPVALIMPPPQTTIGRVMNSSSGRFLTFTLTLLAFIGTSVGLTLWQAPERVQKNEAVPVLIATLLCGVFMFTLLPALAKKAGMAPSDKGVDWKPYFVFYRLSFYTAIPAFFCLAFGQGSKAAFGEPQGPAGQVTILQLDKKSMNYFQASDGFVGLNLTKGVIETLQITTHGGDVAPRKSRFRDAELRINTEAFSEEVEPTLPPGALKTYRVAPVFGRWSLCAARFSMSVACLQTNPVVGWAVSTTYSLCSDLHMVACNNPRPVLDPVYQCASSSKPLRGSEQRGPVFGLCGRVATPPREGAVDELSAILLEEGWPQAALPNVSQVWLDVSPDECISRPEECIAKWDLVGSIGILFAALTGLCIVEPCVMDCVVDKRIRDARRFIEDVQKTNPKILV